MPVTHTISEDGRYVRIIITGTLSVAMVEQMLTTLVPLARAASITKALVDV
jgi:hypothetical protein